MADQAPEILSPVKRLQVWVQGLSDFRLSLYMVLIAAAIASLLYILDRRVFGPWF